MNTAKQLIIGLIALFAFSTNLFADQKPIPMEGELSPIGVRSTISTPSVELSFDEACLYIDFHGPLSCVQVLLFDENNNIVFNAIYENPQSEIIQLESLSSGSYSVELHANGRVMWGVLNY